jgi:hypothetical protein
LFIGIVLESTSSVPDKKKIISQCFNNNRWKREVKCAKVIMLKRLIILTVRFLPTKIHVLAIEDYTVTSHEVFCMKSYTVLS